jgi:hypothetical protein
MKVLMIDIGGSNVKVMVSGNEEMRKFPSCRELATRQMVTGVIGGGNAKVLDPLPPNCRRTSNREAILGAVRLWEGTDLHAAPFGTTWRVARPADAAGDRGFTAPSPRSGTLTVRKTGENRPALLRA